MDLLVRFHAYVEPEPMSGCHLWTGGMAKAGYGLFFVGSRADESRKKVYAHRFAYESVNGPIAKGLEICHKCDNPACVNPDHMLVGTRLANMRDMASKGRGHKSKFGIPFGAMRKSGQPNKWEARIFVSRKRIYLGTFATAEEASAAALAAKRNIGTQAVLGKQEG